MDGETCWVESFPGIPLGFDGKSEDGDFPKLGIPLEKDGFFKPAILEAPVEGGIILLSGAFRASCTFGSSLSSVSCV